MKLSLRISRQTTLKAVWALVVFVSRFNLLPVNISLVGSFGFLSRNFFLFAATIVIFDLVKGGFYPGFLVTYLGFFSYYLLGRLAADRLRYQVVLLPLASFSFFVISNLGVFWYWYPHDLASLQTCFLLALPFYKNTLIGDLGLGYGILLFQKLAPYLSHRFNYDQI